MILLLFKSVGSALARFERSTLPEHNGTRTVVLSFLKIITPVKSVIPNYDGYIVAPQEGELHRRCKWKRERLWSANIDDPKFEGPFNCCLRLLWGSL